MLGGWVCTAPGTRHPPPRLRRQSRSRRVAVVKRKAAPATPEPKGGSAMVGEAAIGPRHGQDLPPAPRSRGPGPRESRS